jgi:predicted dienelactone hydrolase
MIRVLLSLVAVIALAATALADGWNAGWRQIAITDPQTGGEMPVMLWYPTVAAAADSAFGPFTMNVAREAAVAPGRHGLVVLSHGSGGSFYNHRNIAIALARRGYVVAAPLHPRDNSRDHSGVGSFDVWAGRPRQVSAAIDAVLADPGLVPVVDPRRIGAAGHSAGGYTVLALLGAQADMAEVLRHCLSRPADDVAFCNFGGTTSRRNSEQQTQPLPPAGDPRIRAGVAMAPVGVLFTPAALGSIHGALRIYHAEQEELLTERHHAGKVRDALQGRAEYVSLANAGHFSFIAPFPPALVALVGVGAQDPPGLDRAALQKRLEQEIVAFFDAKLPR